jgi:hypothetical protein
LYLNLPDFKIKTSSNLATSQDFIDKRQPQEETRFENPLQMEKEREQAEQFRQHQKEREQKAQFSQWKLKDNMPPEMLPPLDWGQLQQQQDVQRQQGRDSPIFKNFS